LSDRRAPGRRFIVAALAFGALVYRPGSDGFVFEAVPDA
jgi:hypothetical protein